MSRPRHHVHPGAERVMLDLLRSPKTKTGLYAAANKSHGVTLNWVHWWVDRACQRGVIHPVDDGRNLHYIALQPGEVFINGQLVALPSWLVPGKPPVWKYSKRVHRMVDDDDDGERDEAPRARERKASRVQQPQQKTDKYANKPLPNRCGQRHIPAPAGRSQQPA